MTVNLPPTLPLRPIDGIRVGTAIAHIRYRDRPDLAVFLCDEGSVVGGVFTQNRFRAAPVLLSQSRLGNVRGVVVNSGNANAATGERGLEDADASSFHLADLIGCDESQVLPCSTGVIGEFLPMDRMRDGIDRAYSCAKPDGWNEAAQAILTTDTAPKGLSVSFKTGTHEAHATGIVKGSGMVRPDMATLLAFVATDVRMSGGVAKKLAWDLAERSFNRLTIDGDTSTNDSFLLIATGRSAAPAIEHEEGDRYEQVLEGITPLVRELATRTVRDGEGATKFITIKVAGGRTERECLHVAYTIAHSPLIKTAAFAGDPNWGRFCMAIGRAGIDDLDVSRVSLDIDDVAIARNGLVAENYCEESAAQEMSEPEFVVLVDLGRGSANTEIWTSDLSYDYVKINAEYRT